MRTQVLWAVAALIMFTVVGCSKDDTEAPVISLNEPSTVVLRVGQNYQEPGFTASDNEDGDITSGVQVDDSELNTNQEGTYSIYYSVSDEAGNTSTAERTVIVYDFAGIWSISEACGSGNSNYSDTISVSSNDPGKIIFTRFANYRDANAYAIVSVSGTGGTVTIPSQSIVCGNDPQPTRQFSGSGTISILAGELTMVVNYTEVTNGSSTNCSATYTKQF